eukprot:1983780-Karenia_brevis.AAC.1
MSCMSLEINIANVTDAVSDLTKCWMTPSMCTCTMLTPMILGATLQITHSTGINCGQCGLWGNHGFKWCITMFDNVLCYCYGMDTPTQYINTMCMLSAMYFANIGAPSLVGMMRLFVCNPCLKART